MARKRNKENLGLPPRWRMVRSTYYYSVPPGTEQFWDGKQQFRLGKSLTEAHETWRKRVETDQDENGCRTVGQLLDKYLLEVVPDFKCQYKKFNETTIVRLKKVFGEVEIGDIKPRHIYQYITIRRKKIKDPETGRETGGLTVAMRETEVFSAAYTKAVEWGILDSHPFKGEVEIPDQPVRDRYVTDDELFKALSIEPRRKKGSVLAIHAYLIIKVMTGMSRGDMLALQEGVHIKEDGIHIQRRKTSESTGKRTHYQWTPELKEAVDRARKARPAKSSFLFCTNKGMGYNNEEEGTSPGWKSMWQRFMVRVIDETGIEPFHDHDIRAKAASDAITLEHARALLSHSNTKTTVKFYRRKPEVVQPLQTTYLGSHKTSQSDRNT